MTPIDHKDLKPGQRVRLTFEVEVKSAKPHCALFAITGIDGLCAFSPDELAHMTVELLPDPIHVGDRVELDALGNGTVLAIHGEFAWVKWGGDRTRYPASARLDLLTKVGSAS